MDSSLCDAKTLKIVSVNRYIPVWTNIFLFLPPLLALTQIKNPTLIKFGFLGLIVATVSLLHHIYSTQELNPKDLCKKKKLPSEMKSEVTLKFLSKTYDLYPRRMKARTSLKFLDGILACTWGIISIYLVVRSPVKAWALKGTALILLLIALFFFILASKRLNAAGKYYKKFNQNNLESQENTMEYDLYHGFWHTVMGMVLFVVVFLYINLHGNN